MSARDHRPEIALLVALVVLTGLGLGVGVLLTQGDDTAGPPPAPASSPAAATSDAPSEAPTEEPGPAVGRAAFVYACQLLPREDVERIFGALGPDGRTRQVYLTRVPGEDEPTAPATRAGAGVTTSCDYTMGDSAGHILELDATQLPTTGALARRWAALRSDGQVVPRTAGRLVSLPEERSFVLRADPVIVQVRYATWGDLARERPMSPRERTWQERRVRQVLATVTAHVADGSALYGPQSVNAGLPPTGAPYLSPCVVLTDTAFEAAGGPRPGPTDADSSYVVRDVHTDVPVSTCERRGTEGGRTTYEVLEVRVAGTPAAAKEVQAKHLANRYPKGATVRTVTTAAGRAHVVDVGGRPEWPWRTRAIHVVAGPYELHLSVLTGVTREQRYGRWVDVDRLVAAADELVRGLGSDGGSDVP